MSLRNPARARLTNGELALGAGIRIARTVEVADIMKTAGFDWLFIDLEHGAISIDVASQMSIAALNAGIAPLPRVPKGEYSIATRLLDNGAVGIVVPHVETADEAREIVSHLKYPPFGNRSVVGAMPHFGFRSMMMADTIEAVNAGTLLVVMIESPLGVTNAAEIAAVGGIDVVMVGSNDLCAAMGLPGQFESPRYVEALATIAEACAANGKWAGLAGLYSEQLLERYLKLGFRFVLCGNDLSFMQKAATSRADYIRSVAGK